MKAERRHELKTNALAQKIIAAPDAGRKYFGQVALVVAVVVVVAFIIYRRSGSATEARNEALVRLSEARRMVEDIRRPNRAGVPVLDAGTIRMMRDAFEGGKKLLTEVGAETDDAKLLAQAILLRGDMNLALYDVPLPTGATTNPALRPTGDTKPETLLGDAAAAYQDVVDHYADQPVSLASAYFGLATVAEDKGDFAKASELYQKIAGTEAFPQALRNLAKDRIELVPKIAGPVIFGDPDTIYKKPSTTRAATETTAPTTARTTTQPAPTSQATRPAAVTATKPATGPTTAPAK